MTVFLWKNSLELFQHSANRSFPIFIPSAAKKELIVDSEIWLWRKKGCFRIFQIYFYWKSSPTTSDQKKKKKKIKCMDKWNDIWIWNARTSVLKLIRCQNADGKTFQEKREVVQIGLVIHELSACPEQVDSVALWGSTGVKTLTHQS